MAGQMNILDARNHLSKLVSAAEHGEDTILARRGRAVARITRVAAEADGTAIGVVDWLASHPLPGSAARRRDELDEQVRAEREGWA